MAVCALSLENPRDSFASENLNSALAKYRSPSLARSLWQAGSTFAAYGFMWWVMWQSLFVAYELTLLLAVLQAGLTIRLFVIHHDCGHGSFFRSRRLNDVVGFVFGALTLTPYRSWQWSHARHHATSGNLDRRGHGDVRTLTVGEYRALSPARRLGYRLFRNPVVLFGVMPMLLFVVVYRFPNSWRWDRAEGWRGVLPANAAIAVGLVLLAAWLGWGVLLALAVPVVAISTTAGVWLFYVQHQFEDVYWARDEEWQRSAASLEGSSYYALPRVLEWFTGSIGFHHIHHLDSRIPNFRLRDCFRSEPRLQQARRLTIRDSFRCLTAKLWDERERRMVGFRQALPAPAVGG